MISLSVLDVKTFMTKLLMQNAFDFFVLREMELQTITGFTVSGQLNEGFFSKEELDKRGENRGILWSDIREIAFSMIKGNKTPLSLKIVFQLPKKQSELLLQGFAGRLNIEDMGGLFINIRFEKGELRIISGTAIKTFTLDKTLEREWDIEVKNILRQQGIVFEE
jgi:hypothetical protein